MFQVPFYWLDGARSGGDVARLGLCSHLTGVDIFDVLERTLHRERYVPGRATALLSLLSRWRLVVGLPPTCATPIGSTLISRSRIGINAELD